MLFALTLREMITAVQLVVYSVHVNWLFLVGRLQPGLFGSTAAVAVV